MESEREREITTGPDIERFLADAVAATLEYSRRMRITYVIPPPDQYTIDTNSTTEYPDVSGTVTPGPLFLARLVRCCNTMRQTAGVSRDPKTTIADARGWKTAPFFFGTEIAERLASTAICYNLIVYLTSTMKLPLAKAISLSSAAFGASNLAPFIGGCLADAFPSRVTTVAAGSIIYLGGLVVFNILLMMKLPCQGCSEASTFEMLILLLSLTLQAIGSGSIRPCTALCAADQFDESSAEQQKQIQKFFRWRKVCMASAMMVAVTVLTWIRHKVRWGWWSFILSISMMMAVAALLIGIPFYRIVHANCSPLTGLMQVLVAAIRKRKLSFSGNPNMLHEVKSQEDNDVLPHTESMRWLDKAAVLDESRKGDSDQSTPWMLCTVQQVEELKKMLKMAPIWLCASVSAIVYVQTFTIMTEQAATVDLSVSNFHIPEASMAALSILTFLLFVPLYDAYLVKILRKLTGQARGLTCLQRVGVGICVGILAMAVATIVEMKRMGHQSKTVSGFILVPQFLLTGLGESFLVPGLLEFFNDETPSKFQGFTKSFVWAALGMAGILNTILVSILQFFGWFGTDDLNSSLVDCFYLVLATLGVFVFLVYLLASSSYEYTVTTDHEACHTKFETTGTETIDDSL